MSFLQQAFEKDFQTKSNRLTELYFADVPHLGSDTAMHRHRERWFALRCEYSRHPGADHSDPRFVRRG
jgi:hypothetical protein